MIDRDIKKESLKGFTWRVVQNISTQLASFAIQIVLARILLPEDYGIVALTSTFIAILNVIVTTGFSSSIVQKKEITDLDKSSMFYLSVFVGLILYGIVFAVAPALSSFYNISLLSSVFRIQGISLIVASVSSVHNATLIRHLDFKKSFIASFVSVICQGAVGITMAFLGYGVWALVFATLANNLVNCCMLFILCKWIPKSGFSISSTKKMFSFSFKVLLGNLLNTVYNSIKTLIIGKVYDSEMVGYYNKGYSFPTTMMVGIDGAMTTVLFSTLSKIQDDKERFVLYLRKSMKLSLTIVVPMLCGMAAVADPMIRVLLTDKWEGAIPFVMLTCAICLSWPLSARTQALNAVGKSGTNLIINIIMKVIGIGLIIASIPFGVYVMCLSSLVGSAISFFTYSIIISKNFNYSFKQQLVDVFPIYLLGFLMFGFVFRLSFLLNLNLIIKLIVLVAFGATFYLGLSFMLKMEGFMDIIIFIKKGFSKKKQY